MIIREINGKPHRLVWAMGRDEEWWEEEFNPNYDAAYRAMQGATGDYRDGTLRSWVRGIVDAALGDTDE